jgi:hypothetical protein
MPRLFKGFRCGLPHNEGRRRCAYDEPRRGDLLTGLDQSVTFALVLSLGRAVGARACCIKTGCVS